MSALKWKESWACLYLSSYLVFAWEHKGQAEASGDGKPALDMSFEMCQLQARCPKSFAPAWDCFVIKRPNVLDRSADDSTAAIRVQLWLHGQPIKVAAFPNLQVLTPLPFNWPDCRPHSGSNQPGAKCLGEAQLMGGCVRGGGNVVEGRLKLHVEISICACLGEEEAGAGNNCHSPLRLRVQTEERKADGLTQVNH